MELSNDNLKEELKRIFGREVNVWAKEKKVKVTKIDSISSGEYRDFNLFLAQHGPEDDYIIERSGQFLTLTITREE